VARLPDWAGCRRAAAHRLCEWQVVRAMAARSGDVGAVAPSTRGDALAQVENLLGVSTVGGGGLRNATNLRLILVTSP
jgi:hypothetical protein